VPTGAERLDKVNIAFSGADRGLLLATAVFTVPVSKNPVSKKLMRLSGRLAESGAGVRAPPRMSRPHA
jgi:hypothetical protein